MLKEVVGEAIKVEYSEKDGKLYITFEIINEKYKQSMKKDWVNDIEFIILDKKLILEKE